MTARAFLGLSPTDDAATWRFVVQPATLTPAGAVQGGCVFAAAVEALEGATGRPLVWATGQYLSHLGPRASADVAVTVSVHGHQTTQARAEIIHDGVSVLIAVAALGARPSEWDGTWVGFPDVPAPEDCAPRPIPGTGRGTTAVCEVRTARGRSYLDVDGTRGPGRSASWVRLPGRGVRVPSAGDLAVVGDFVMLEVPDAVGVGLSGNSLDNTLRVAHAAETGWVLVDATVHAVAHGFCSVSADLWSEGGTLLGSVSQTLVLRALTADGRPPSRERRITGA